MAKLCTASVTVEGVERLAVSNDGQRVVVVELVVELVRVVLGLGRLSRAVLRRVMRGVMLLAGVVIVAALGADGEQIKIKAAGELI